MNEMNEKIRIALIKKGMTLTQLAEKWKYRSQIYQKIKAK